MTNGITWVNNTLLFPSGFDCSNTSFTAVKDESNYIWIFCGDSGQIWKGRLEQQIRMDENRHLIQNKNRTVDDEDSHIDHCIHILWQLT